MGNELLIILTLLAGFYMAWSIGANDVANAMGTSVGSGALTLRQAVLIAAVLEFSGAFFFGSHVSGTLQNGIVDNAIFSNEPILLVYGMLASLIATGMWLQAASYFGWPVSTTHAIVGGVIGFGAIIGGIEAVYWNEVLWIVGSWVISPILGGLFSYLIFSLLRKHVLYTTNPVEEAVKLAPFFVFIVFCSLSLILMSEGFKHLHLALTFFEIFGISVLIGLLAATISYYLLGLLEKRSHLELVHPYSVEAANSLEKAKKHLQHVIESSHGETRYQCLSLLEEVDRLLLNLKSMVEETHSVRSEYRVVEKLFGYLQIMSACLMAFSHGANDVANAIGPLSAALYVLTYHTVPTYAPVPMWALALGGVGVVVGLATWGWRVIATIGRKITELTPTRGFAAEFGAANTILFASFLGFPISTTHTLVGSVIGVGFARGIEALDLTMTRDIVISWIVTIPISSVVTVGVYYLLLAIFG